MRKTIISLASGIILSGFAFTTSVSAEAEYEIQKGDSLSELAQEYGTSTENLMDNNNLSSYVIMPGEKIEIDNKKQVEVMKGDTLSELARDLEVDVKEIKEWNNLDSSLILVGQDLELQLPLDALKDFNEFKEERKQEAKEVQQTSASSEEKAVSSNNQRSKQNTASKDNAHQASQTNNQSEDGETISVTATAYTADCSGCSGITATGINLNANPNMKVIAVDPNIIPLGTKVYVEGYGVAIAADTGGAINGNKIDVHVPTKAEAYEWGVKTVEVEILD
ncbi:LysM peptidoglycan-binding domain-containing protein [Filobacillus milosensis]|uniref:LysM peptidoglycan-binding domain-containing protein n=1 Tax=Filobacillus milosensis TaxID=94137 RepID=A0A4Y8IK49_9BACI|nr:3D domain-containing protein [Filobacillus milosensis]TFB21336.1 LysM peptidoglycan-binding domain-containing protein [Filobacillus milosensis]